MSASSSRDCSVVRPVNTSSAGKIAPMARAVHRVAFAIPNTLVVPNSISE